MSKYMFLPFREKPRLDVCRDGGSIDATFTDLWGRSFVMTLPVKWGGESRETMEVIGYNNPTLTQYLKTKKISKGNGKPYYVTSEKIINISRGKAVTISKKILKAVKSDEAKLIATDLLFGISSNGKMRSS